MASDYSGVYLVGAGQTPYEKSTTKSVTRLFWEATSAALSSAGLTIKDIDGFGAISIGLPPDNVTTLVEHFGIECRWLFQGAFGGATGIIGMMQAARAIQAGDAEAVVIAAADAYTVNSHKAYERNSGQRDYMAPWGYGAANGIFALLTRHYMNRFGATREDFGRLAVAQRENALRNPNAIMKKALTLDEYMNGRVIADPIYLYDCVYPCCGADAFVIVGENVARKLSVPKIKILGGGQMHNSPLDDPFTVTNGWPRFRDQMYAQAHCTPGDLHFAQVYDDYPVMSFIQIEGLGFCPSGKAGDFIRDNGATFRDKLPVNTGGGQLSAGQAGFSGGFIGIVEAILQLRGEAGERQVKCDKGVVAGFGVVTFGRGLSTSAAILARA